MSFFRSANFGADLLLILTKKTISKPGLFFSITGLIISKILLLARFLTTARPFLGCPPEKETTTANLLKSQVFLTYLTFSKLPAVKPVFCLKNRFKSFRSSLSSFLSMFDSKPLAASLSAPCKHVPACFRGHPLAESVGSSALFLFWVISK